MRSAPEVSEALKKALHTLLSCSQGTYLGKGGTKIDPGMTGSGKAELATPARQKRNTSSPNLLLFPPVSASLQVIPEGPHVILFICYQSRHLLLKWLVSPHALASPERGTKLQGDRERLGPLPPEQVEALSPQVCEKGARCQRGGERPGAQR